MKYSPALHLPERAAFTHPRGSEADPQSGTIKHQCLSPGVCFPSRLYEPMGGHFIFKPEQKKRKANSARICCYPSSPLQVPHLLPYLGHGAACCSVHISYLLCGLPAELPSAYPPCNGLAYLPKYYLGVYNPKRWFSVAAQSTTLLG